MASTIIQAMLLGTEVLQVSLGWTPWSNPVLNQPSSPKPETSLDGKLSPRLQLSLSLFFWIAQKAKRLITRKQILGKPGFLHNYTFLPGNRVSATLCVLSSIESFPSDLSSVSSCSVLVRPCVGVP